MKKVQKVFCVLLAVLTAAMVLTACPAPPPINNEDGVSITVKIGTDKYEVSTEKNYLGEVLDNLVAEKNLHLKTNGITPGRWIEEIGTLIPNPTSEYIAVYASTDNLNYADPLTNKTIDGIVYYYTLKGMDEMPVLDGVTYLFLLETF